MLSAGSSHARPVSHAGWAPASRSHPMRALDARGMRPPSDHCITNYNSFLYNLIDPSDYGVLTLCCIVLYYVCIFSERVTELR
jgi:hypothetical protein